ncbi:hypothetical protein [Actinoplanes subglobosus]|uniref:Uncharacterized protein n=1 Tax=Actinoplanes subglobosus TaxID=1547892 RepID=A0ABV8IKN8_9ACTN
MPVWLDAALARGELFTDSGDLSRPVGRPPATVADAVAEAFDESWRP